MAFMRCRNCEHYNDVHTMGPELSGRPTWPCLSPNCHCKLFEPRGDSPEGTDIYRNDERPVGYHVANIQRGVLGELSKVQEELDEAKDAASQGVKIMELVELSDMIGAVVRYLEAKHPGVSLDDLIQMHRVTRRAFDNGVRKERT